MVTKGERGWRATNQEFGINRYTPIPVKQITNTDLLYSTENYTEYFGISYKGTKTLIHTYIYIYVCIYHTQITESLSYTPETNTTL